MLGAGRLAVVTGGTRGIGRATSLALARRGMRVLALYARNHAAAETLREQAAEEALMIETVAGDLTRDAQYADVLAAVESAADRDEGGTGGDIHVLVHAAASGIHRPPAELTARHLRFTFDTNVVTIHRLLGDLLPRIPHGGRVIALTSAGATHTIAYYTAIGTSKGALDALIRHWAWELAPKGIAVNLVCPGMVETDALDVFPDRDERVAGAASRTPTGRLTTPDEVAALVRFLCSEDAAQIVGQTLVIDGGKTLPS